MIPLRFSIDIRRFEALKAAKSVFSVRINGSPPVRDERRSWVSIRPVEDASDREALAAVARRCRDTDPGLLRRFAPDGLVAELADRPGRRIRAWVARLTAGDQIARNQTAGDQIAGEQETAPATDVGLLILVETGAPPRSRFSVAWLLVDPAVRRRGVALALVGEAVRHVRSRGGTEVEAETLAGWSAAAAFWRCLAGGPGDPTAGVGHRSAGTPET